jgi:hypothetical protein
MQSCSYTHAYVSWWEGVDHKELDSTLSSKHALSGRFIVSFLHGTKWNIGKSLRPSCGLSASSFSTCVPMCVCSLYWEYWCSISFVHGFQLSVSRYSLVSLTSNAMHSLIIVSNNVWAAMKLYSKQCKMCWWICSWSSLKCEEVFQRK